MHTGTPGCTYSNQGGTDCGYDVQTKVGNTVYSELAHLYYETLGNLGVCNSVTSTANTCDEQTGWGLVRTGPFANMKSPYYWSGLKYAPVAAFAWYFEVGRQNYFYQYDPMYIVAVRPGDVTASVPEPESLALVLVLAAPAVLALKRRIQPNSAL